MLTPVLIPLVFFITTAVLLNNLMRYRFQRRIIDSGLIDEAIVKALLQPARAGWSPLKWGLLGLFGGVGLIVLEFVPYSARESPLPYGVEAIFLALGLLLYHHLERRPQPADQAMLAGEA